MKRPHGQPYEQSAGALVEGQLLELGREQVSR